MSETEQPRYFTERLTGHLAAPVQRVWDQWTDEVQIEQWYPERNHSIEIVELAREPRGEYSVSASTHRPRLSIISHGTIVMFEPPHHFLIRGSLLFARADKENLVGYGVTLRGGNEFFLDVRLSDDGGLTHEIAEFTSATRPFNHQFIAGWWSRCLARRCDLLGSTYRYF